MRDTPKPAPNSFLGHVAHVANAGLAFLYPESCHLCNQHRATPAAGYVCEACRAKVQWVEAPWCNRCGMPFHGDLTSPFECGNCRDLKFSFSYARSAALAREQLLEAIHEYKYRRALWLEPFLADVLCSRAAWDIRTEGWEAIVPVPLHPTKERQREFNQAERLARHLGAATGVLICAQAVKRVLPTATQTRLTREERTENVRGAFQASPHPELTGRRVVLVDDVFTTGATTNACAEALLRAGVVEVCVWTLARGI